MEIYGGVPITSFEGEFRFLSNFWPCEIEYKGVLYPSLENAYQAAKFVDESTRLKFTQCPPGIAKRKAKFYIRRDDWEDVKVTVMSALLIQKFISGIDCERLGDWLLRTGSRELIEGNTWGDKFWGVCDGEGQNMLGVLLMQTRDTLRAKRRR